VYISKSDNDVEKAIFRSSANFYSKTTNSTAQLKILQAVENCGP